ncbi:MAG: type II toxin-antitoxin system VapC family toxin [Gemmatimonadetes bacterium]|nr:type II toxin-antitoxin system VapC family toxin [Gemmatimonadota bacterium]MCH8936816.1 type II toxin-antitoxin system VapC family toxin [Gemmatimonadota bacterium]
MRIVVDTSVLVAVIANEPTKRDLIQATRGAELLAPASVHWEVGNAFAAMLRRKRAKLLQVRRALEAYANIPIRFVDVGLPTSMELADELKIYAYDAYVLACAQEQRAPLLTLDRGLLRAGTKLGIEILEFGK